MRIGFYGGIANNMYVFAKAFAAAGVDTSFIRDRSDRYPFSQPVWEDVPFRIPYESISETANWPWDAWTKKEKELRWVEPNWVFDPLRETIESHTPTECIAAQNPLEKRYFRSYFNAPLRQSTLGEMRRCDALVVCGIEGSLLAKQSQRPYIIWPHGGDTMVAAGLFKPPLYQPRSRFIHSMVRKRLVNAYKGAVCLGSHEPTGICAAYMGAEIFVRQQRVEFIPIPIPTRPRQNKAERRKRLSQLLSDCGAKMPEEHLIGFVPSRIDFQWKGHDKLLQALVDLKNENQTIKVHLIFVGWGADFGPAQKFVRDNDLDNHITLLNCALSKPLLFDFFLNADFVVDQFVMGLYGTAALEAMACGAPLAMWINDSYERPWGIPPVFNIRTASEIAAFFGEVASDQTNLERRSVAIQNWMGRVHCPSDAVLKVMGLFSSVCR